MQGKRIDADRPPAREPDASRAPRLLATLSFTAEKDFLALARSTTMHVAGLVDLPFSQANDLRLAVDEACALFLTGLGARGSLGGLALVFAEVGAELRITVSGPAPLRRPDIDSLGWMLLCALVGEPRWEIAESIGTLTLCAPIPALN